MCNGKCSVGEASGGQCKSESERIVDALEKVDGNALLAHWRTLDKPRKDALKRKLFPLAMA